MSGKSRRVIFERYRTASGKKRDRVVRATETTYRFTSSAGELGLVVRESPDGVAYRYELPRSFGAATGEASAFVLPADSVAWLAKYRRDYENPFLQTTAGSAEQAEYMHPALFEVGGSYALITESDVDGRYSGGRLVHVGGGRYQVKLWDSAIAVSDARRLPPGSCQHRRL